ncbi:hypothetical protein IQ244_19305 [Nostoc sp. LEGE 06077]|uniref:hypothetical protein n=1 Tax=Nostoc sp. LEGE 06077 TaxID=915325 RepID=UPI0018802BA0|nr:hypothetical protein [Nostoc sp. LEGE 06077]MBE9208646.1 hypothetical protein [Nostoc sp. LEGE 06077]
MSCSILNYRSFGNVHTVKTRFWLNLQHRQSDFNCHQVSGGICRHNSSNYVFFFLINIYSRGQVTGDRVKSLLLSKFYRLPMS